MELIGAGFGRTGTASLKIALEQLGYEPCYHMLEVFQHPGHGRAWQAAARGELKDWDNLLGTWKATVDWPGAAFWDQLVERYPDAKVILTVRDPERWYESTRNTIYARTVSARRRLALPPIRTIVAMIFEVIWTGTFEGRFEDRAFAIDVFNRHNQRVRDEVPAERLLVYDVREGWGPLCAFLGVPEPETEFPHVNTTEEFNARARRTRMVTAGAVGAVAAAAVAVARARRRA